MNSSLKSVIIGKDMKVDIITIFPEMFKGPFDTSMIKKAKDKKYVEINIHDLRKWAEDKHKSVDDRPFGGGKGMVLRVDVLNSAISDLRSQKSEKTKERVILLSPQGKVFNQVKAKKLSELDHLILIAGHYEGFDERISKYLVDEEISIGDYILTGGEIPAMVLVDSIVRLIPGVLDEEATSHESFSYSLPSLTSNNQQPTSILDFPTYTRPEKFLGWKVPKVLLSGNHAEITKWRNNQALAKTKKMRPDLLKI